MSDVDKHSGDNTVPEKESPTKEVPITEKPLWERQHDAYERLRERGELIDGPTPPSDKEP